MRTTTLHFFYDEVDRECGLAHENAINIKTHFNAFWDQRGIFHDVWEHYFEGQHKYFQGNNSFNIGGEIAAMGHCYYYTNLLRLSARAYNGDEFIATINNIVNISNSKMKRYVSQGWPYYGNTLECGIPYQKKSPYADDLAFEHWHSIKNVKVATSDERGKESALNYKKSIKLYKLQRLYRWGHRQAEKMVHNNYQNLDTLNKFYSAFTTITERNAKDLSLDFKGIEFKIKGGNRVEWDAYFIRHDSTKLNYKHLI
jgi:hypothetical protein